jgi:flagellar biosynthesis/type III secretory pathway protein FliH
MNWSAIVPVSLGVSDCYPPEVGELAEAIESLGMGRVVMREEFLKKAVNCIKALDEYDLEAGKEDLEQKISDLEEELDKAKEEIAELKAEHERDRDRFCKHQEEARAEGYENGRRKGLLEAKSKA